MNIITGLLPQGSEYQTIWAIGQRVACKHAWMSIVVCKNICNCLWHWQLNNRLMRLSKLTALKCINYFILATVWYSLLRSIHTCLSVCRVIIISISNLNVENYLKLSRINWTGHWLNWWCGRRHSSFEILLSIQFEPVPSASFINCEFMQLMMTITQIFSCDEWNSKTVVMWSILYRIESRRQ